jgi:nitroreductase
MATTAQPVGHEPAADVEIDLRDVDARLAMPLAEAMRTQRAVRRLRPDPVDDEVVLRCIELATRAPTGSNKQQWEFVVVRDAEVKHQLARLNRQALAIGRRVEAKQHRADPAARRRLAAVRWQADHFEEVPVVVVVCLHGRSPVLGPPIVAASWYGSAFPAAQNLLLAARAVGLGGALTTMPIWSVALARRTLGLPRTITPVAAVPLGWPKGHYGPTTRRPVGEVVHLDRFGNQPFREPAH